MGAIAILLLGILINNNSHNDTIMIAILLLGILINNNSHNDTIMIAILLLGILINNNSHNDTIMIAIVNEWAIQIPSKTKQHTQRQIYKFCSTSNIQVLLNVKYTSFAKCHRHYTDKRYYTDKCLSDNVDHVVDIIEYY